MSSQLESMPLQTPPAPAYVLGVRVDRLSQQQALDRIEQMIALHRSGGNAFRRGRVHKMCCPDDSDAIGDDERG